MRTGVCSHCRGTILDIYIYIYIYIKFLFVGRRFSSVQVIYIYIYIYIYGAPKEKAFIAFLFKAELSEANALIEH